jgi:menaquinone-dependent protoporphyrinogen oxidase
MTMTTILIAYATSEGQTRKIAEWLHERFRMAGHRVQTVDVAAAEQSRELGPVDAAVVAGSVHVGQHAPELVRFARERRVLLESVPNALLSVSLAAADPAKRADVDTYLKGFFDTAVWVPKAVVPVAGALRYSQYGFFKRLLVRWKAGQAGLPTDTSQDHELTDWSALGRFADAFLASIHADDEELEHIGGAPV